MADFWALQTPNMQSVFHYFICRRKKKQEWRDFGWEKSFFLKSWGSIGPIHTAEMSLQQRFQGRQSRNLGVISHEISAQPWNLCGQRLQCAARKAASKQCVWGIFAFSGPSLPMPCLGYLLAACRIFLGGARCDGCEEAKARFNANQQQKIAKAHPSGAFKEGKVWFAKNVKNSNWMTKSCGQGTADEPGMEELVQNIRRKIPEKDF